MASWGEGGKGGGKGGRIADPTSLKLRRASGTRTLQGEKRCASFPLRPCGATATGASVATRRFLAMLETLLG
jgi:hypothetical protein